MVDVLFDDSHALIQILGKGNCQTLFHFVGFNSNNNEIISNRVLNELFFGYRSTPSFAWLRVNTTAVRSYG